MASGSVKMTPGAAWVAWGNGSPEAGSEFLERVSAWTQGTTAQLLRARWPGTARPSSAELESRLQHHLELVARAGEASYPEAFDLARRNLIEEITGAETRPRGVDRQVRRPRGPRLY